MQPAPEFSSLIVSRPCSRARLVLRVRGLACAATLYAAGLACLLVAPLLMIEMLQPPKADTVPPEVHFPSFRGDDRPAGTIRKGVRNGSEHAAGSRSERPAEIRREAQPVAEPIAPPESEVPQRDPESPGSDDEGNRLGKGDPGGKGRHPEGPLTGCLDCPGIGPGNEDGPIEEIYYPDTGGLIPPQLIPSTRALPKYPDLPRRAGVQGTVILLIVVEKDGSVGQIEVVRSSDQRWGFDLAAIGAVKQWRYRPALLGLSR